MTQTRS